MPAAAGESRRHAALSVDAQLAQDGVIELLSLDVDSRPLGQDADEDGGT